ncbi:RNA-directed DNA polymerase [Blautia producta]|uniref:RNA-directed DNA polymerase n=1 Tax=Blautia producta TaxID=33035 RepID=UPI0036F42DD3
MIRKMITFNNIDQRLYDEKGLEEDFKKTAKGKRKKPQVQRVREDLERHKTILADQLRTNTFTKNQHSKEVINEASCKKTRTVQKPAYLYEQPAHHAIIRALMPALMRGMYDLSCGSIPNRGAHYGKKYIEKWIRKDPANCKYILKFDIHHFFQSVPHRKLKKALKKKIKDKVILKKVFTIIDSCEEGLPIGYYSSQWFGNFYLTPLDHYIKEELHIKHMIRYMDDVVCFGRNKKELHKAKDKIEKFIKEELGLEMKGDWQVFRFDFISKKDKKRHGRPLDFMGFKFYRDRTTIRKSILNRTKRKVNKIKRKGKVTWKDAASILSRMGYIRHTDTYGYYLRNIKPVIKIKVMKQLVSKHARKEKKKWNGSKGKGRRKSGRKI